ncbi:PLP-dependent aminotransferase family protein [Noviherbaspirillum sp. UKPF54]|uniref:MocR-like pyridoxine biosynthesis transcription factor PdxR n=1 Tax=Noviherbaspirillum sp. UKPF54 TaxID=2601898 RepID=UPI0011B12D6C|nr:PLP-dependent aminotransferase family protein [Noviherbaspirillum sp. UKPF54]QDZ28672.1 PLP-dependent aminotransferase family protein [Noviherbaspirillum sp. UKPF54]
MRVASLSDFLLQRIDRSCGKPVNRQLYQVIREAILAHVMPVGLQLPSSRDLARELNIARNTVTYAYEQLMAEGYLETRTGAGTFVADTVPDQIPEVAESDSLRPRQAGSLGLSERGAQLVKQAGAYRLQWGAFMPGVPDVTAFPNKVWSRLQNKYWRRSRSDLLTYGHGSGYLPLREAIAEYLRVARSVNCAADQVIVTSGIHQSIDLASRLLADVGDRAWVEDPCYWGTRNVLTSLNLKTVPIAVDAEGISPRDPDLRHPPRFIFVTPSHQYPLGQVMSLSRRRMLLEYADMHNVWIMEDDYDSEFRYASRPLASLQGMDTHDRVLYFGSFSKTLFPGLRVGFVVVPPTLAGAFATGLSDLYRCGQLLTQAVLADFMAEGHFASHIRRMRVLYAERQQLLREAIRRNFGDALAISGDDAGLHLALLLPEHCDDAAICRQAQEQGIIARPLSGYYMKPSRAKPGLILGYACVPSEMIGPTFDRLAGIIRGHL